MTNTFLVGIMKMIVVGGVFLFKDLIIAARSGSGTAFSELSEMYKPLIESMTDKYVRSIGGGGADREDLRQESSVAFYKAVMTYDIDQGEVSFGLYAKICIRNRLISILRSAKSRAKATVSNAPDEGIKPRQSIFDRAELDKISCEILSKREKDVFLMYADGKSYAEISHSLKIGEKSVDNALFRAKKKLRAYFSGR